MRARKKNAHGGVLCAMGSARSVARCAFVAAALGACGGHDASSSATSDAGGGAGGVGDAGGGAGDGGDAGLSGSSSDAADANVDGATTALRATATILTTTHRAIPGQMFGGWGPHLGHLVRRPGGELWFIDDACDPSGADACDVNVDRRIDAFRFGQAGWEKRASIALPAGVQQNTGTIVSGDAFESYGVDVSVSRIVRCTLDPTSLAQACADVPIQLPPLTNYVGAAISPDGWRVAWATTVADGGGGSFSWMVDYGGGWNGPRTGAIGGYNDASYINAAFYGGARKNEIVMHAQLVSGLAPAWSFFGATGAVDTSTAGAVTFDLLSDASDTIISTNDVLVDTTTNDTHLFARTQSGAAAYFFQPDGGSWSSVVTSIPNSYRVRLVLLADGRLALVRSDDGKGLAVRIAPASARVKGEPVDWTKIPEVSVPLPDGYENIDAIYAEAASYQGTLPSTIDVALVGAVREQEVLHVHIAP